MGAIQDKFEEVYRDFVTDGVRASGVHKPNKAEVREIAVVLEKALEHIALVGLADVRFATTAAMNADLAHEAGTSALVYDDADAANNDLYQKTGAAGGGTWELTGTNGIIHDVIEGAAASFTHAAQEAADEAAVYAEAMISADLIARQEGHERRTVAQFGDSRGAQETWTLNTPSNRVMSLRGVTEWAGLISNGRIRPDSDQNFGVGGQNTTQFLTRLNDVKRCAAGIVFIPGWINDSAQGVDSLTVTQPNMLSIVNGLRDAGKIVLLADDYPSDTLTTAQKIEHAKTRDYVRSLHNPAKGVFVARTWDAIATAPNGGSPQAGMLSDGVHPSVIGAHAQAAPLVAAAKLIVPDAHLRDQLAPPLNPNPDMVTGLQGGGLLGFPGATGSTALDWFASNGAGVSGTGAADFTKPTVEDEVWQQVAISGNWNASPYITLVNSQANLADFAAGDLVEMMCRFEIDAGHTNLRFVAAQVLYQTAVPAAAVGTVTGGYAYPAGKITGTFFRQFRWPSGATRAQGMIAINFQGTAASGVFRFRDFEVRKIA
ncbi:hypothetical protein CHH26_11945 [Qipengyuania flava]|uniref:GDSL-type esterase/lipase family protein n=1 Tax=Qipengyuania flava TaxID=192812 RepID=UPI000B8BF7C7|nr:GDSL-type esterase/lipase family protein [Qipengyuania flava]ASP30864.1 hypothetical protein CHH26_11945 [Qipengyuania flava]